MENTNENNEEKDNRSICYKCGHKWYARTHTPLACPSCKRYDYHQLGTALDEEKEIPRVQQEEEEEYEDDEYEEEDEDGEQYEED